MINHRPAPSSPCLRAANLAFIAISALSNPAQAATTLSVGDISIIGYSADKSDQFAFVPWVDLEAGTSISFTDRGWRTSTNSFTQNPSEEPGSSGLVPSDGNVVWVTPTAIAAGTVITGTLLNSNPDPLVWSTGSSTGDFGHTGMSNSGESIFAYQGSAAAPALVFGLYYVTGGWSGSDPGQYSTTNSQLPSVLNTPIGNIAMPAGTLNDNGFFSGSMSDKNNLSDYRAQVLNTANWTIFDDDSLDNDNLAGWFSQSSFTAVPEPASMTLLGMGALGLLCQRRRKI